MRLGPRARDNRRRFDDSTRLEMKAPVHCADRISSCAILLAGVVGGVLVFVVALPLALSSPFPTPRQGEWIILNSTYGEASSFWTSSRVPPPMEPLPPDPPIATVAQPEAISFAERWNLAVADAGPPSEPVPSEAAAIEVPTEATRLAPVDKAATSSKSSSPSTSD